MTENNSYDIISRKDYLEFCKRNALGYALCGQLAQAVAVMAIDLDKHPETKGHIGMREGYKLLFSGQLRTQKQVMRWIEGFN